MKLISCRVFTEVIPLRQPFKISYHTTEAATLHFVEWQTDTGHHGWGSCTAATRVTGESDDSCAETLQTMTGLQGEDVRHLPRILRNIAAAYPHNPAARAAVDMALHDLLARQLGVPLVKMLGQCHRNLPTSVTLGLRDLEETLTEAQERIAQGFSILKVKLGQTLAEDLERLHRLREVLPPETLLRVDPNQAYSLASLRELLAKSAELRLEFIEQPMSVAHTEDLRQLPSSQRERLILDESLHHPSDALRYGFPDPLCGGFNIKLMKSGGLRPAQQIANLAEQTGRSLMWGCNDESRLSLSAALHQALACPATRYLDLDGDLDLQRDPAKGGYRLENGVLYLTSQAGLGVSVE